MKCSIGLDCDGAADLPVPPVGVADFLSDRDSALAGINCFATQYLGSLAD